MLFGMNAGKEGFFILVGHVSQEHVPFFGRVNTVLYSLWRPLFLLFVGYTMEFLLSKSFFFVRTKLLFSKFSREPFSLH